MNNKVLIADDEPLARARLRALVEPLPGFEVVAEAETGEQVLQCMQQQPADTVLLDIRMPGMDGMQAAEQLQQRYPQTSIIFTTAFPDHALEAFDRQAQAYLLKPVRPEALQKALDQARLHKAGWERISRQQGQFIHAHVRGNLLRIPLEDIPYLQASQKYVQLPYQGHQVLIEESLVQIEQRFPSAFLRIHRNALVNPRFIQGLERDAEGKHWLLLYDLEEKLEVSRRNLSLVRQFLKGS